MLVLYVLLSLFSFWLIWGKVNPENTYVLDRPQKAQIHTEGLISVSLLYFSEYKEKIRIAFQTRFDKIDKLELLFVLVFIYFLLLEMMRFKKQDGSTAEFIVNNLTIFRLKNNLFPHLTEMMYK